MTRRPLLDPEARAIPLLIAEKIKQEIMACDALVVRLTENGRSSSYVQQEIGFAEACGKPIIPLIQPGVAAEALAMLQGQGMGPV